MTFSGAVRISDLNDFIAPSQSCVVALNGQKKLVVEESSEILLQPRAAPPPLPLPTGLRLPAGPRLPGAEPPKEGDAVKVTLHDCLACSGCVTTAETMLLEQQSAADLQQALDRPGVRVVVSVSPQSRAALAALYGLSPLETWQRLVVWLRSLGVAHVCDIGTARDLALLETAAEFIARYQASTPSLAHSCSQQGHHGPASPHQLSHLTHALAPQNHATQAQQLLQQGGMMEVDGNSPGRPLPTGQQQLDGMAALGSKAAGAAAGAAVGAAGAAAGTVSGAAGAAGAAAGTAVGASQPLPMLASACPGWVCYAEKTQGATVLPYLSSTKSPQAVMGTIVKRLMASRLGLSDPSAVYHCTVMPCYDKKLEASREELTLPETQVPEVDCCLTTYELHQLMLQRGLTHLADVPLPDSGAATTPADAAAGAAGAAGACGCGKPSQQQQQQHASSDMDVDAPSMQACDGPQGQGVHEACMDDHAWTGNGNASNGHGNGVQGNGHHHHQHHQQAAPNGLQGVEEGSMDPHSRHLQQQQLEQPQLQQQQQQREQQQEQEQEEAGAALSLIETESSKLWGLPGGSGGYMEFVFRVAAAELFGHHVPAGPLPLKQLRNSDFQEVELRGEGGQVLLRCAIVNGFRNIQTLMRQIKMKKCQYHYVEVMACPSGCLNGGGQIKPGPGQTPAQLLEAAEAAYHNNQVHARQPSENPAVRALYQQWVQGAPGSQAAQHLLHTTYKHRGNTLAGATRLASDW